MYKPPSLLPVPSLQGSILSILIVLLNLGCTTLKEYVRSCIHNLEGQVLRNLNAAAGQRAWRLPPPQRPPWEHDALPADEAPAAGGVGGVGEGGVVEWARDGEEQAAAALDAGGLRQRRPPAPAVPAAIELPFAAAAAAAPQPARGPNPLVPDNPMHPPEPINPAAAAAFAAAAADVDAAAAAAAPANAGADAEARAALAAAAGEIDAAAAALAAAGAGAGAHDEPPPPEVWHDIPFEELAGLAGPWIQFVETILLVIVGNAFFVAAVIYAPLNVGRAVLAALRGPLGALSADQMVLLRAQIAAQSPFFAQSIAAVLAAALPGAAAPAANATAAAASSAAAVAATNATAAAAAAGGFVGRAGPSDAALLAAAWGDPLPVAWALGWERLTREFAAHVSLSHPASRIAFAKASNGRAASTLITTHPLKTLLPPLTPDGAPRPQGPRGPGPRPRRPGLGGRHRPVGLCDRAAVAAAPPARAAWAGPAAAGASGGE